MDVFVANEQQIPVDEARSSALARHTLESEDVDDDAELSVLFVTSDHIKQLNKRFAGNNHATDVLAFPLFDDEEEDSILGDVVICPSVAAGNATKLGHDLGREVDVLLVHGTLHLVGYDHQNETDKEKMDRRIQELLSSFIPQPAS
jgi:probable rRNA maturation factor